MRKMHKWLIGLAIGLIVIAGVSYVAVYVGSNMLLGALITENMEETTSDDQGGNDKQSNEDLKDPENSAENAENNESEHVQQPEISEKSEDSEQNSSDQPVVDPPNVNEDADDSADAGEKQSDTPEEKDSPAAPPAANDDPVIDVDKPSDDEGKASKPESGSESDADPNRYTAEITDEKQEAVKENITMGERLKLVTTLGGALSPSEISTFMKMAEGGLSVEEKKEAKKIMLEKLSEEEYNELIEIAAKYGLSQGKTYEEGLEELEMNQFHNP